MTYTQHCRYWLLSQHIDCLARKVRRAQERNDRKAQEAAQQDYAARQKQLLHLRQE